MRPSSRRTRLILLIVAVLVTATMYAILTKFTAPIHSESGIPLPFGEEQNALRAGLTSFGTRSGIPVYDVTFRGEEREVSLTEKAIYLVHIPNDPDIENVPIDQIMLPVASHHTTVDFFCYRYADAAALTEKSNVRATKMIDRFPGKFCASGRARSQDASHGNQLALFEKQHGVSFLPTDASAASVRVEPNTLFVIVINDDGGAILRPRRQSSSARCGDGILQAPEECDDGNIIDDATCDPTCHTPLPIPFTPSLSTTYDLALRLDDVPSSRDIARTATDVPLLSFRAVAGSEPVHVQSLITQMTAGSFDDFTRLRLLADSDDDGTPETVVLTASPSTNGTSLVMRDTTMQPLLTLAARAVRRFSIIGDVRPERAPTTARMELMTTAANVVYGTRVNDASALEGVRIDGACLFGCQIDVTLRPSTTLHVQG